MRLEVLGVSVVLGSREVLRDVTLKLEAGEMLALLGPNGSGKSTLLRTIFGVLKPAKGAVLFDGRQLGFEDVARIAAYLPQESPETRLRVLDVVLLGRTPHLSGIRRASPKDYEIAKAALREVSMEGFADRPFVELSGGERQKVLLARLFAQQPGIMLLDEPTAHLDISAQLEIMNMVRKRVDAGSAAIVAMHDVNLAAAFADKVLMIKGGRVAYAGRKEDIITAESIRDVYGIDAIVRKFGKYVYVVPVERKRRNGKRVHVICGGGSGAAIIQMLSEVGYDVSAGVLNVLDSDWELATNIGCEVVSEAPFSDISEDAHRRNLEVIKKANAVVLANLSVGRGNLKNLYAALAAAKLGKLIVVDATPFAERNFAGEEAEKIYDELLAESIVVKGDEDVVEAVRSLAGG